MSVLVLYIEPVGLSLTPPSPQELDMKNRTKWLRAMLAAGLLVLGFGVFIYGAAKNNEGITLAGVAMMACGFWASRSR